MLCEHAIIRNKKTPVPVANEEGIILHLSPEMGVFFMIIILLSSAFRLGCFPISCSAFRASRICFFCSAFYISGFFRGAFRICVLCFGCGTFFYSAFFYSAFFYSAFFSCSCFDYAFDSGFCFRRRLCLGSIVAVNCKSNRKYDYCKYCLLYTSPSPRDS